MGTANTSVEEISAGRIKKVTGLLLKHRNQSDSDFWPWLGEHPADQLPKKAANKFLLGCMLDYQMQAVRAWERSRYLAEEVLGDPDDLWGRITAYTEADWLALCKSHSIHRFGGAHQRVWRMAGDLSRVYWGDAREIWKGQSADEVLRRLNDIRLGEQLSRMTVGALFDNGHITGTMDVKADIHVTRVINRVFLGRDSGLGSKDVTELTRRMHPDNPWLVDEPLFTLGRRTCEKSSPKCVQCYLAKHCAYHRKEGGNRLSSIIRKLFAR